MGITGSKIIIFKNDKGEVIKDYDKDKIIWRYNDGKEYDCELNILPINDVTEVYNSIKTNYNKDNKFLENGLMFCNCKNCIKVDFDENYLPKQYINYQHFKDLVYNIDKFQYKIQEWPLRYQEVTILPDDIKNYHISFDGITFTWTTIIFRGLLHDN